MVSNARRRGRNVRDHDGVGIAFTCIGAGLSRQAHSYHRAVCGRRHHRRHRPRAGTAARGGLGSTGRDREQAGRRHRPGRHRIRREIRARRLHAAGDRRRDLRHLASYLQQAAVRPDQRFRAGHRSRHQPAGAGRAPLAAGAHARRAGRLRQEEAGRAQLRHLRHRIERTSQHHPAGRHDRHQIHAGALSRRRARASPTLSAATSR